MHSRNINNSYVPRHLTQLRSNSREILNKSTSLIKGIVISNIIPSENNNLNRIEIKGQTGLIALIYFNNFRDNFNKIKKGDKIKFFGGLFNNKSNNIRYHYAFFANAFNFIPLSREERTNKINNLLKSI